MKLILSAFKLGHDYALYRDELIGDMQNHLPLPGDYLETHQHGTLRVVRRIFKYTPLEYGGGEMHVQVELAEDQEAPSVYEKQGLQLL